MFVVLNHFVVWSRLPQFTISEFRVNQDKLKLFSYSYVNLPIFPHRLLRLHKITPKFFMVLEISPRSVTVKALKTHTQIISWLHFFQNTLSSTTQSKHISSTINRVRFRKSSKVFIVRVNEKVIVIFLQVPYLSFHLGNYCFLIISLWRCCLSSTSSQVLYFVLMLVFQFPSYWHYSLSV